MIQNEYLIHVKEARNIFFEDKEHPTELINKEILDSWVRSSSCGLTPTNVHPLILSADEVNARIKDNSLLYSITASFMEYLYQFVKGSGFIIIFADQDGYVLKLIGDEEIVRAAAAKDIPLVVGSCRSEVAIGTNSIGTPLHTHQPIQLFADEHFVELSSDWTCSGAPIVMEEQILGVFCISGSWDRVHTHTLGMAMAASEAIARQYSLTLGNEKLTAMRNQLQTAIDSLHTGTILLDETYRIAFVNANTLKNLQFAPEELIGHSYREFFPLLNLDALEKSTYDIESVIQSKTELIKCYISIKFVHVSPYTNKESFLISFRRTEYIQELVNRVIGSDARYSFSNIIGSSTAIQQTKKQAELVAKVNTSVLITGESGTGKELFAQSIHNASPFREGPFIALNCGALPKELVESELFGYDAGSFTGARKEGRAGKFELANNGTIFLDEIGDMPYDVQVKLLRVIQEKCVTRIGGKKNIPLNVRIITATNVDLEAAIHNHTFRSDLYYRLNVFNLTIPPLCQRGNDVLLLTSYFLEKYQNAEYEPITVIDPEVEAIFLHYPWPGNIRELENTIERACILTANGRLSMPALPSNIQHYQYNIAGAVDSISPKTVLTQASAPPDTVLSVTETEKQLIITHLSHSSGNIKKAADSLGMSRRTLYRKLEKYQINLNQIRFLS